MYESKKTDAFIYLLDLLVTETVKNRFIQFHLSFPNYIKMAIFNVWSEQTNLQRPNNLSYTSSQENKYNITSLNQLITNITLNDRIKNNKCHEQSTELPFTLTESLW